VFGIEDGETDAMEGIRIAVGERHVVTGLLERPDEADALLVLAHGAGAGMRHPFLEGLAEALSRHRVATLRYQFPYMEAGGGPPDPPGLLRATVRAAVAEGRARAGGLPLLAGGKSLGGRMTSSAQAQRPLPGVSGLVFVGFPLHPAGRPSVERGEHVARADVPMLFLQGTRDRLASLDLLRPLLAPLGARARLHVVEEADHSFHVTRRSGRTDEEVLEELARVVSAWRREPLATG
jgi:predicted alpha/beta-hydrolase family hydrolase